jgi:hypothetical protein
MEIRVSVVATVFDLLQPSKDGVRRATDGVPNIRVSRVFVAASLAVRQLQSEQKAPSPLTTQVGSRTITSFAARAQKWS